MSFELKIALRYILARKRTLTRFTAAVAVAGIAAGVAALTFADALARGFADELRDKILANSPHITISAADGRPVDDGFPHAAVWSSVGNIAAANRGALEHGIVSINETTSYTVISASGESVRIGSQLAARIGAAPGDRIEITTLTARTPMRVTVTGLFETGLHDYDATRIEVPPDVFAALVGDESFTPRTFDVKLDDVYLSAETAARLRDALGPDFKVVEWQETNRVLFAALLLERRVASTIIALIVVVAALNIAATLTLLAHERRFDIGVLRACGARSASIRRIFLIEGFMIGLAGSVAGIAVGIAGCALANRFRLVSLPPEVYSLNFIPLNPSVASIGAIALSALVLAVAAAAYPARAASRVSAIENLRSH